MTMVKVKYRPMLYLNVLLCQCINTYNYIIQKKKKKYEMLIVNITLFILHTMYLYALFLSILSIITMTGFSRLAKACPFARICITFSKHNNTSFS
jgi:hypothetical protein